jgi:hypothetical protein
MIPDYYDPRKVGELFLEDPARIAKAAAAERGPREEEGAGARLTLSRPDRDTPR